MATFRLTSIKASTLAHPVVVLSSARLTFTPPVPKVRLTSASLSSLANVKVRLTRAVLDLEVYGVAPDCYAGGDLQVNAGEQWTLLGAETAAVGQTIVNRTWTINSRIPSNAPDIVLSSTSALQPTFRAPILEVDAQYEFSLTVTTNTGQTSDA